MKQSLPIREALRIFRFTLLIELGILGLGFLAVSHLGATAAMAVLLRAAPTVLLALLVLPTWLEIPLGRWFLALTLGLDVFFESLMSAPFFFDRPALFPERLGVSVSAEPWTLRVAVEPFFFLLIPLVLLAWAYGRRGALRGSTWAALLHLATGYWALQRDMLTRDFFVGAVGRITLLYAVPLIVSVLAQRERRQHSELEAAHQRLRRHAAAVEQLATSHERNRLARELHDTLSHSLAALTVQLQALRSLLVNDPEQALEAVDDISTLAREGLEESRRAIQALRLDPLKTLGLVGALRGAVQAFQARTGAQADLSVAGRELELTDEESQMLYRVVEEALTNVEQHAAAQQVTVRLAYGSDRVDISVQDDGTGFDFATVEADRYGITGMRERCEMIGASLDVYSRPGGGTEVWCSLER